MTGGNDPPAVAYSYAPGRGAEHAIKLLAGFSGILQVVPEARFQHDGYAAYKQLTLPTRTNGVVVLAYCWSHLRRKFYELYVGGPKAEGLSSTRAPIATAALARIKLLYEIEAEIRGLSPEVRRAIRQARAKPLIEAMKPWFEECRAKVSKGSKLGDALAYGLNHWDGLCRYLDDGRVVLETRAFSTTRSIPIRSSVRSAAWRSRAKLPSSPATTAAPRAGRPAHRSLRPVNSTKSTRWPG